MKLFIEACDAKESWRARDESARSAFLIPVGELMKRLTNESVDSSSLTNQEYAFTLAEIVEAHQRPL